MTQHQAVAGFSQYFKSIAILTSFFAITPSVNARLHVIHIYLSSWQPDYSKVPTRGNVNCLSKGKEK